MKTWLIGALMLAVAATIAPPDAQAKRLGAGRPAGMQRDMPARTAPDAPAPKPAQPAPQQAAPAGTQAAQPGAPAAAPKRSWMGPLAGLAAGLGIGALLSHFGMGEGMGNFLMMALLAGGAIFLVMFLVRRFAGGSPVRGLATAGAGGPQVAWPQAPAPMERRVEPQALPALNTNPSMAEPALAAPGAVPGSAAPADPVARVFVPATFDTEGFTRTAKQIFIRLQAAHDTADLDDLRRFTTPELFASIRLDIQERGNVAQHTDVAKVDAEVLDVAQDGDRQIVSVRFHGQVVEEKGAAPTDFNEIWHLVKPTDDSKPWSIAGIEPVA